MHYYQVQLHWRKCKPILESPRARQIWTKSMIDFLRARGTRVTTIGSVALPKDFDSADWRSHQGPGRKPAFWDYVCHGACHWLVNLNLYVAQQVAPTHDWRIVRSEQHSTVWDGWETIFDMNQLALGTLADECFKLAKIGLDDV